MCHCHKKKTLRMKSREDFDRHSQACPLHYVGFTAEKNETVDHIERRRKYRKLVGRQEILGMLCLRRKF